VIEFKSFLAADLEDYIEFRKAAGYRYKTPRWFLWTLRTPYFVSFLHDMFF